MHKKLEPKPLFSQSLLFQKMPIDGILWWHLTAVQLVIKIAEQFWAELKDTINLNSLALASGDYTKQYSLLLCLSRLAINQGNWVQHNTYVLFVDKELRKASYFF
jgi:hypothetical protein